MFLTLASASVSNKLSSIKKFRVKGCDSMAEKICFNMFEALGSIQYQK